MPTSAPTERPVHEVILLTVNVAEEQVAPGEIVIFELKTNNLTNEPVKDVAIEVAVPKHTRFSTEGSTSGWQILESSPLASTQSLGYLADCPNDAPAGTQCKLVIAELSAGQALTIHYAARVANRIPSGASLNLAVTVDGQGLAGGVMNKTDLEIVTSRRLYLPIVQK